MPWIKKNLMLVLGGLVGLVLLGGSAFFLFTQSSRESTVNIALEEKRAEWNRLNGLNPYPDEKNIKAVKDESSRVNKLVGALRENIKPPEVAPVTDTFSLKLLIETTISELKKEAEAAGVHVPDRYAFTFQKLREMPQFESSGIPKLAEQVAQISALCRALFDAKIHSLDQLRRPAILKEEGGSTDYLTKKAITNNNLIVRAPYDVSFRCFSSELAGVIRALASLDQLVAIKTINIEPTTLPPSGGAMPTMIMPSPTMPMGPTPGMMPGAPGGGMDPALRARYGLGAGGMRSDAEGASPGGMGMDPALRSRYGLGPGGASGEAAMRQRYGAAGGGGFPPPALSSPMPGAVPAPPPSSGPAVILDEKPLRVILQLDFVKPKPEPEPASRRATRAVVPESTGDTATDAAPPAE